MDNDAIKIEELKLIIKNLLSLRQNLINILIVLISGVIGVCFMPNNILKFVLIGIGLLYIAIFGKNLHQTEEKINNYLFEKRREL